MQENFGVGGTLGGPVGRPRKSVVWKKKGFATGAVLGKREGEVFGGNPGKAAWVGVCWRGENKKKKGTNRNAPTGHSYQGGEWGKQLTNI